MIKLLLQTKELVKELMVEKFGHIFNGEIPPTYPILCSPFPELIPCDYCWLWLLHDGMTICLRYISTSRMCSIDTGYHFSLLKERPKTINIPNALSIEDRVIKTLGYQRFEFNSRLNSITTSKTYGTAIEFIGPCQDLEQEIGFWECDNELPTPSNSTQHLSQQRIQQAQEMAERINQKYHK